MLCMVKDNWLSQMGIAIQVASRMESSQATENINSQM